MIEKDLKLTGTVYADGLPPSVAFCPVLFFLYFLHPNMVAAATIINPRSAIGLLVTAIKAPVRPEGLVVLVVFVLHQVCVV